MVKVVVAVVLAAMTTCFWVGVPVIAHAPTWVGVTVGVVVFVVGVAVFASLGIGKGEEG